MSKSQSRQRKASLSRKAPKRTGKRGIGPAPLDEKAKKPRQARLPEMDDPIIEELEAAAENYVDIRDQRLALTPQEKQLKDDLLAAMKRHSKEKYTRDGIEIRVVHESETVKVKIKKEKE